MPRKTPVILGIGLEIVALVAFILGTQLLVEPSAAQTQQPTKYPEYQSETPDKFEVTNDGFEYTKRTAMIPMRDGAKLYTVILVPKGARSAPILLTRTPYNAKDLTSHAE